MNVLLVDAHPLFVEGFAGMVRRFRPGWTLQSSDTAIRALKVFQVTKPDLVVIDAFLPNNEGFLLLRKIALISPVTPQILMSESDSPIIHELTRSSSARGLIAKSSPPEKIVKLIDEILFRQVSINLIENITPFSDLTFRHLELLTLLASGFSNSEISQQLDVAERTVRFYLTEIFQTLNVNSRLEALVRARDLGLIR